MDKLSDLIKGRLNKHNLNTSAESAEVLFFANKVLSGLMDVDRQDIQAFKLKNGVLFIGVKNSTLSQELWGKHEMLLDKLKKRFGETIVKKIQIKSLTIR